MPPGKTAMARPAARIGRLARGRPGVPGAGSPAGSRSPSRWAPRPGSRTGPASWAGWARSTRGWPATWPPWCVTVTDEHGHAVGHGCARPGPGSRGKRAGPGPPPGRDGFTFTPASRDGPPGGYGTWRLRVPGGGPGLIVAIDTLNTRDCEHRYQARGHDPGVRLRHLAQVRHATCTSPVCRRPAAQCDFEHNTPYEAGGRTCLCNGDAGG
jgi:hypothetical protein